MDITGLGTIHMKHIKSVLNDCVNLEWNSTSGNGDFTQWDFSFDIDSSTIISEKERERIKELCLCDKVFIYWDGHENGFAQYKARVYYERETLKNNLDELRKI